MEKDVAGNKFLYSIPAFCLFLEYLGRKERRIVKKRVLSSLRFYSQYASEQRAGLNTLPEGV